MTERGDCREELRLDVLTRDEQLDRLDAGGGGGVDQVLALDREQPGLLPVLARLEELADEPKLLVVRGGDQADVSSAAFARSATAANAFGSDTARSASDLRSSSIPDLRRPSMKRL